ncbi:probable disease resistance protein RPP1 [Ipomoea triloba]|uniref:probable disease resistance protein RPP1 n=1 Tax=Ipomoea triloba TaxID=35885 RepID=UPI00125DCA70|nr:probable disease resistance protein RPP1 [Ipomoea triloba]
MGREIVLKKSPREPCKQSRLIDPKDVFDVLHGNKGTEAIEGMIVNSNMLKLKNVPLSTQVFKRMVHPSIGSLEKLVELDFKSCKKLKFLPSSICKLKSLEVLCLKYCEKLRELPIELGKLEQLRELLAGGTAISHIPFSLGCLRNLKTLDLWVYESSILSKPKSQLLDILSPLFLSRTRGSPSVVNLCSWEVIENLTSLVSLDLSGRSYYLQNLPFGLRHLSNLKSLYLNNFQNLRILVKLPPSLEELSVENCVSLEKIAVVSNLKRLKVLCLGNCKSLVELLNMGSLSSLVDLDIRNCNALAIPDNYLHEVDDVPIALRSLSSSLKEIDLMGRYYLQSLPLSFCHQYSNLERLYLDDLQNLRLLPQLPPNLEILSLKNCVSLEKIADLSNLKRLGRLDIQNCKSLVVELSGLESLESLHCLGIANCSGLRIPSIQKWFKASSKVAWITLRVGVGFVSCCFLKPFKNTL